MKRLLLILFLTVLPALSQQYKVAIVSMLHSHVFQHIGPIMKNPEVKLVGISETVPSLVERAKRGDARNPAVPESLFFSDWKKMIEETKPDFVWAFTPTSEHVDVVRYCAPRGIHVMMEKPLSATYKQALEMQKLAKDHNILVMTNFGSTWGAANWAAKEAMDSGVIGPVWRLRAQTGHGGPGDPKTSPFVQWLADPDKNGGGALVDFGCYLTNWSLWLRGTPQSVYAVANHMQPDVFTKVEDHATIILNYKDGISILEATWDLPPSPRAPNEIYGKKGSIVANQIRVAGAGAKDGEPLPIKPLPPERAEPISYMVDHIRRKKPLDGPSDLALNVNVMEVLEAAKMSVKSGRTISLPLSKD